MSARPTGGMIMFVIPLLGVAIFRGSPAESVCDPLPHGMNLARSGKATQSSQYPYLGTPDLAIDGKWNATYLNGSCTSTDWGMSPWWRLDLQQLYQIASIVVLNRQDCCPERLRGAEVRIGNSPDNNNPTCGAITDPGPGSVPPSAATGWRAVTSASSSRQTTRSSRCARSRSMAWRQTRGLRPFAGSTSALTQHCASSFSSNNSLVDSALSPRP